MTLEPNLVRVFSVASVCSQSQDVFVQDKNAQITRMICYLMAFVKEGIKQFNNHSWGKN